MPAQTAMIALADEIEAWAQYWGQPLMLAAPIRLAERILERGYALPQTDEGALASGPTPQAAAVPPAAPSSPPPRRFRLIRHFDVSGVSGIGDVAEGVQFADGAVALRWKGDHPSTVAWDSIGAILAVHGHHGATDLEWLDPLPADEIEGVTF